VISGIGMLVAFGIGIVAGLRSMTAPAVVAWAAHLGWISLAGSPVAFMGSMWALVLFSLGALAEYVVDQLPSAPSRTDFGPLAARVVLGLFTGACLAIAGRSPVVISAVVAGLGALVGAFGGHEMRVRLVRRLRVPDAVIAIPEDLVAIGLGLLTVSRF
jgi:uncharacterized membrane protein